MKHLFMLILLLFANLMAIESASAQSFTNPVYTQSGLGAPSDFMVDGKYVNDPSDPVIVPATGNKSVGITAQLHRRTGTTTTGYVSVYYGTSPTNLSA